MPISLALAFQVWSTHLAQTYSQEESTHSVYWPPQWISESPYTTKADIWMVGVLAHELFHGQLEEDRPLKALLPNRAAPFLSAASEAKKYEHFLRCCLLEEEAKRYSAAQLLEHPFLAEARLQYLLMQSSLTLNSESFDESADYTLTPRTDSVSSHSTRGSPPSFEDPFLKA